MQNRRKSGHRSNAIYSWQLFLVVYNLRRVAYNVTHKLRTVFSHDGIESSTKKHHVYCIGSFSFHSTENTVRESVRERPVWGCTKTTTTEKKPSRINGRRWIPCLEHGHTPGWNFPCASLFYIIRDGAAQESARFFRISNHYHQKKWNSSHIWGENS